MTDGLPPDFPAPSEGMLVTHLLVASDVDRSRDFYTRIFEATVVRERDPCVLKLANSWIMLNTGGGPTGDKPSVTLEPPSDPDTVSSFLNIRVADMAEAHERLRARGAEFLTEPKDHGVEIRAYVRDPDGHLIELGETTGLGSG